MSVIAVYSVKGGVGKTTISVDLAYRCAAAGHETLLWDLDPQGGAAFMLGLPPPLRERAMGLFHRSGSPNDWIEPSGYDRLSLIPGDMSLRELPLQLARMGAGKRLARLAMLLSNQYTRIILDCPPVMNQVSEQIVNAADVIIMPLSASPLSARALDHVREELARHGRHPPLLPVLSMYDVRRRLHRVVAEGFAAGWPMVPASSYVEQAALRRAPLPTFANWCPASRALERLYNGTERKLGELGRG